MAITSKQVKYGLLYGFIGVFLWGGLAHAATLVDVNLAGTLSDFTYPSAGTGRCSVRLWEISGEGNTAIPQDSAGNPINGWSASAYSAHGCNGFLGQGTAGDYSYSTSGWNYANSGFVFTAGKTYSITIAGDEYLDFTYYVNFTYDGQFHELQSASDNTTHFISFVPGDGQTIASTSSGYATSTFYVNPTDWTSDYRYIITLARVDPKGTLTYLWNTPHGSASIGTVPTFNYIASPALDFSQDGHYQWSGTICKREGIWIFQTCSNIIVASTSDFWVGTTTSPYKSAQRKIQDSLDAALASTTLALGTSCNPIGGGFDMGNCLVLVLYPGTDIMRDDLTILEQTPPWGYVFRVIDILNATTSTSTLPSINYAFASSSPMAVLGNIHFDPFQSIHDSGTLIAEMHSDRSDHATVWDILMPVVRIFIYAVLGFMIIHDLTGIHSHAVEGKGGDTKDKT